LDTVFHAVSSGDLHVIHLKGSGGEIGLRVGDGDWFGVINVGDSAKLIQICEGMSRRIVVSDQQFSSTLFHTINDKGSSINLLIGAKKFSEGWSSWRVSTMGLMNVGKSEGSEIIQLFGRGVRLKGYDFTLKRSSHIHTHKHPMYLGYLETLNVFGVNSNYMDEFKDYLEEEGVGEGATETITLPVIANLDRNDLKIIRPKDDLPDFKKAEKPILMRPPAKMKSRVVLDWYPKIQSRSTKKGGSGGATTRDEVVLGPKHLAFIDSEALWFDLEQFKGDKAYYNLQIDRSIVDDLLNDSGWYTLYVQKNEMDIAGFDRIHVWQEIALALLKKYCESYYRFCKNRYEAPHLEYQLLDASDPNFFEEYEATIHRDEQAWIDKLNELKTKLTDGSFKNQWKYNGLTAMEFTRHLYKPLIHFHNNEVLKIAPVSLNDGERDFVQDLKDWYRKSSHELEEKDLYLLRNQSKGKGVGFFDAGNFYPDFILWLIDGKRQHVLFIDPKGLLRIQGFGDPKISFCKEIKNLESLLNDSDVTLESFIVSNTKMSDISWWSDGEDAEKDFANNHILFQKDHSGTYIQSMMSTVL